MDEQLYLMGLGLSLEEKVKRAIATFQMYEPEALKRDPVNGYYLCDSYGKDSGVILHLAKAAKIRFMSHHNLTTLDPPELIRFGRLHHPETIVHRPKMAMLTRLAIKTYGPPTRLARWCCEEYKEQGGKGMVKVFGVRAAESARRKAQWRVWTPDRKSEAFILNSILYWSDDDVWQYTRKNNIPYCCLYDEGKTRLGCIGCPMNEKGRADDFKRWPKYEAAWKRAVEKFWNNHHGTLNRKGEVRWFDKPRYSGEPTWTCWQDLWRWWMEEMPKPRMNRLSLFELIMTGNLPLRFPISVQSITQKPQRYPTMKMNMRLSTKRGRDGKAGILLEKTACLAIRLAFINVNYTRRISDHKTTGKDRRGGRGTGQAGAGAALPKQQVVRISGASCR